VPLRLARSANKMSPASVHPPMSTSAELGRVYSRHEVKKKQLWHYLQVVWRCRHRRSCPGSGVMVPHPPPTPPAPPVAWWGNPRERESGRWMKGDRESRGREKIGRWGGVGERQNPIPMQNRSTGSSITDLSEEYYRGHVGRWYAGNRAENAWQRARAASDAYCVDQHGRPCTLPWPRVGSDRRRETPSKAQAIVNRNQFRARDSGKCTTTAGNHHRISSSRSLRFEASNTPAAGTSVRPLGGTWTETDCMAIALAIAKPGSHHVPTRRRILRMENIAIFLHHGSINQLICLINIYFYIHGGFFCCLTT